MSDEDPTLDVARDLTEIVRLHGELLEQAIAKADDEYMPGGLAMAYMAPVASLEAVTNRIDGSDRWNLGILFGEHAGTVRDISHANDEAETWETPLHALRWWCEEWRTDRGMPNDKPTVASEAEFIRQLLPFLVENEAHFHDFAKDMHRVRTMLENELREGERTTFGVRCKKCKAASLVRTWNDRRYRLRCQGHGYLQVCIYPKVYCGCADTGGLELEWSCPNCYELYDYQHYKEAVTADYVEHSPWLQGEYVERRTGVKHGTVRVWASRGHVKTRKDERNRTVYLVADIEDRHADDTECA